MAPSGPMEKFTGRNHESVDARNSTPSRARFAMYVAPEGVRMSRWTRFCAGSATSEKRPSEGGNAPPRYTVMAHADVKEPTPLDISTRGSRVIGYTSAAGL